MKSNLFFPFFCLLFTVAGKVSAADITITGATDVNSSTNFTYYATPPTPVPSGTTYTWHVYDANIVAQNTDPNVGPLYCTVRWNSFLGQSAVTIEDNNGNSGLLFVTVYGFTSIGQDAGMNNFPVKQAYQRPDAITWNNKVLAVA